MSSCSCVREREDLTLLATTSRFAVGISTLMVGASLFQCNINSDVFHAWTKQDLLPKLPKDAVIVMDNATFHKRQDTQEMIGKKGFILEYLPPYSPDLNPIEQKWAQAKAIRCRNNCSILELFRDHQF